MSLRGFKLQNHPNASNSGLKFGAEKMQEKLNKTQTALETVGMTPGPQGVVADAANTLISLGRGAVSFGRGDTGSGREHLIMAGLHGLSSFPFVGKIAEGFKLGRRAKNLTKNINKSDTPNPKIETPHFKSVKETTHPIRGGHTLTDPVGEYNNLVSMNKIAPENFVKPLGIQTDKLGNVIGFNMSKVKGKTLLEHLDGGGNLTKDMQKQLNTAITKINDQGYYHGDLNLKNIILKPNGKLVIIDPVGAGHVTNVSEELAKDLINRDKTAVDNIIKLFNK